MFWISGTCVGEVEEDRECSDMAVAREALPVVVLVEDLHLQIVAHPAIQLMLCWVVESDGVNVPLDDRFSTIQFKRLSTPKSLETFLRRFIF